jgi:hypothetical protein
LNFAFVFLNLLTEFVQSSKGIENPLRSGDGGCDVLDLALKLVLAALEVLRLAFDYAIKRDIRAEILI